MNIVPNDILGVTKLLRRIISHTTHWSHKNQARYVLKQWKTHEMLQLFHSHVSLVSWLCCIALTNLVSLSEWHMLHLSVAHFTFHKEQHTWNLQHVAMFRIYVSCAISSQRDAWCSCSWNAVQMWKPNTWGVTIWFLGNPTWCKEQSQMKMRFILVRALGKRVKALHPIAILVLLVFSEIVVTM